MDKTLLAICDEKIQIANKIYLLEFVFEYNDELYISKWNKDKWEYPNKIYKI
jgi:hypothetical protein